MVQIIRKKAPSHEVDCRNCDTELAYSRVDVRDGVDTDYQGGRDHYKYITCPNCGEEVRV